MAQSGLCSRRVDPVRHDFLVLGLVETALGRTIAKKRNGKNTSAGFNFNCGLRAGKDRPDLTPGRNIIAGPRRALAALPP